MYPLGSRWRRWFSDLGPDVPAAPEQPEPGLDLAAVLAQHHERWRDRALKADRVLLAGLAQYGQWVPADVVLDAHNILQPPPAVPVVPGPEQ